MQAQRGRAGITRIPLQEIFPKTIEYYLQKTQIKNVHNNPTLIEKVRSLLTLITRSKRTTPQFVLAKLISLYSQKTTT